MKPKRSNLFLLAAATLVGTSSIYALTWDPTQTPTAVVGGAGTWDASTTSNWSDGANDSVWGNSPTAVAAFTGSLGGAVTVDAGGVNVNAFNFTNTVGYTFSGGAISLVGTTPTLTATRIGGTNTATATSTTASIANSITGTTLNTAGNGVVGLSSTAISGAITLGGGGLILSGSNTAGSVAVAGNTLAIGSNTALASDTPISASSGHILLANGVSTEANLTITSGSGRFILGSNADWMGNITYTGASGDITVNSGATVGTVSGDISMTGSGRLYFRNDGVPTFSSIYDTTTGGTGNTTVSGIISGTFASLQVGTTANTTNVTLSNPSSTYDAQTSVNNGSLTISSIKNVGGGASSVGAVTTIAKGTLNIGTNVTGTLKYTGTGDTTDRVINLTGTTSGAILDQSGTGLLKFTSNFTATGAGSKTLTLQGSTAGTGQIAGAIVDNSATNKTSVIKSGTGTWTISGNNTYSGNTTVNAGTLVMPTRNIGSGTADVTLADGATLGLIRTAAPLFIDDFNLGTSGAATLNISSFTPNAIDPVIDANVLAKNAATTIGVSGVMVSGGTFPQEYPLISYGSTTGTGIFTLAPMPRGVAGELVDDGDSINLKITSFDHLVWKGTAGNTWDINTTSNWKLGVTDPSTYLDGDNVLFDDSATNTTVDLATSVTPNSVTFDFDSPKAYTLGGTGSVSGTAVLLKQGTGTLSLDTANTYTGNTLINAGTIVLGHNNALGSTTGSTTVADGATLELDGFSTGVEPYSLDGSLLNHGAGTSTLGGAIVLTADANIGGSGDMNLTGFVSGAGVLTKTGANTLTLTGAGNAMASTSISGGMLRIGDGITNGSIGTGTVAIASGTTLRCQQNGTSTLASVPWANISGAGTLEFNAAGTTVVAGRQWAGVALGSGFTGTVRLESGRLEGLLASTTALGNATAATVTNGGQLSLIGGGTFGTDFTLSGTGYGEAGFEQSLRLGNSITTTLNGTITLASTTAIGGRATNNFNGVIGDSGSGYGLTFGTHNGSNGTAGGTYILNAANTYSGETNIGVGTLRLANSNALQNSTLNFITAQGGQTNALQFSSTVGTDAFTLGGLSGTRDIALVNNATPTAAAITLSVGNNDASTSYSGILSGTGGSLTKIGNGTLTLTGANTYTGNTTVNGGTLSLTTASLADASTVSIGSGAILDLTHGATDTIDKLFINGVQQAAGLYQSSTGVGAGTVLASLTGSGLLQVTSGPATTFATWMGGFNFSAFPGANLTATGDADRDGISNLVEVVFGTAPNAATTGLTQVGATASSLTFKHPLNASLASDVTYSYQWSSDLGEWKSSGESNTGGTTATISAGAPVAGEVTVTTTITGVPASKIFVRIIANQAP